MLVVVSAPALLDHDSLLSLCFVATLVCVVQGLSVDGAIDVSDPRAPVEDLRPGRDVGQSEYRYQA